MKLFFSLFFLFSTLVFALSDTALLQRANKYLLSSQKSDIFRAYNDYKNLYLRAIVNNNDTLRMKALRGIVRSGKKLHIDVATYEKELQQQPKKHYVAPKPKKLKPSKKIDHVKIDRTNKVKKIYWEDGRLVLTFSYDIKKKDINYFTLYDGVKNTYKYIFDIHAILQTSQRLSKQGIQLIKIAQYKPKTLRLVFQNNDVLRIRFLVKENILKILAEPTTKIKKQVTYKPVLYTQQKTIVIDPGHGGKDPGAIGFSKYREKMVVLQIAQYAKKYLEAKGFRVYMTRKNDKFIKLSHRTRYANKKKADLFISIHANASKNKDANGIETYFLSPSRSDRAKRVAAMENKADVDEMSFYGKQSFLMFMNNHKIIASNKLAIDLQHNILLALKKQYSHVKDGGVREGPFWVLVGAQMPAVLIEVGFITNPKEAKRLVSKRYQKALAKGIAEGVEAYFIKNP